MTCGLRAWLHQCAKPNSMNNVMSILIWSFMACGLPLGSILKLWEFRSSNLLLRPYVRPSFNGCMFGENPIHLISEHAINLWLPIVHLSTDCICLAMYVYIYMYDYKLYMWFCPAMSYTFWFLYPPEQSFYRRARWKTTGFWRSQFWDWDGTQHLAQIHSRCADCTHASMWSNGFSWASHSFWRAYIAGTVFREVGVALHHLSAPPPAPRYYLI